ETQPRRSRGRMEHASVAPQIDDKDYAADCVVRQEPDRAADDAKPWYRPEPKDEQWEKRNQEQRAAAHHGDGKDEIARPANDAKKEVEEPDHGGASEDEVRIAQGCLKRPTTRAHGDVDMRAGDE